MIVFHTIIESILTEEVALTKGSQRVMNDEKMVAGLADALRDDAISNPSAFPPGSYKSFQKLPDENLARWFLENLDKIEKGGYEGTVYSRDGVNSEWIARRFIAGSHSWEDITGVMNMNLRDWYLLKNRNLLGPQHRDIPKFNSVRDIGAYVNTHYEHHLKDIRDAAKTAALKKSSKSTKLVDNEDYKIYTVFNRNAAKLIGLGSQWCTANTEYAGHYESYSSKAMLFQVFPVDAQRDMEGRPEKFQFDAGGDVTYKFAFKDVLDKQVPTKDVAERFPFLYTDLVSSLKEKRGPLEQIMKEMAEDEALSKSSDTKTKNYDINAEIGKLAKMKDAGFFTDKIRPAKKPEEPAVEQPQIGVEKQGETMNEDIDKDVAAMLANLKKYDVLRESVAPVLGMKTLTNVAETANKSDVPAVDRKSSGKEDWKVTKADLDDEEAKNVSSKKGLDKVKDETDINEGADVEVLEWMQRFSKLGNMKGYGR